MSKTKIIDIYGITKVCRAVHQMDSHLTMYEMPAFTVSGEPLKLLGTAEQTIKVRDIPIDRIRAPTGDVYVAIEPELREVLEAPFIARERQAVLRLSESLDRMNEACQRSCEIARRPVSALLAMPWWRRALFVMRRENLEGNL